MIKKRIKRLIPFLVVLGLTVAGLSYASGITERKDSRNKYADFYAQKEDFDVLFIGQSRMLNAVFPMELWNDYGIVSYNLAGHGNRIPTNYWVLKNALEYTTPKLVVLDCGLVKEEEKTGPLEQLHLSVDHIPLSRTKIAMMEDLLGDSKKKQDFLWKFSTYHNRWSEVVQEDFTPHSGVEKGAESRVGVAVPKIHREFGREEKLEIEGVGIEYLEKIIEECQRRNIEVLLTYIPFPDPTGWQLESNAVWEIVDKYKINYLDFHTLFPQINLDTDCYDPSAHLNPSGGWKITAYLGEYIQKNYGIADQRENPLYSKWHQDYGTYRQFKWENLRTQEKLENYLMLLYDRNLSFGVWMEPGAQWLKTSTIAELLANIGIEAEDYAWENCLIFVDRTKNRVYRIREGDEQNTGLGKIGMRINFDTAAMIITWEKNSGETDEKQKQYAEEFLMDQQAGAGILVFDHTEDEPINFAQFMVDYVSSERIRPE